MRTRSIPVIVVGGRFTPPCLEWQSMVINSRPPTHRSKSFDCPHCGVFADQAWSGMWHQTRGPHVTEAPGYEVVNCRHCGKFSIWVNKTMVFPAIATAPLPNPDMPDPIQQDYLEARDILEQSPRGSAALLRLSVQKLCKHLGEPGKNINTDIGSLVQKGLPVRVQQALDVVRVIGNNAVHPGQIDLKDDRSVAVTLFDLVNLIVEVLISQPKQIEAMFDDLPAEAKKQIEKRDRAP